MTYDVIVVGAGPAGIFTALELVTGAPALKVIMLEKGPDIHRRSCPMHVRDIQCIKCSPCTIVNGWGGAGAFSDGKLTLTTEFGGFLHEYLGKERVAGLIDYIDQVYLRFGAPATVYGTDEEIVRRLWRQAATAGLTLVPARIRHLGTENCFKVLQAMREHLSDKVEIRTGTRVEEILVENGRAWGARLDSGEELAGRVVVIAPGREGAEWFSREATRLGIRRANNPVDIGVRIEVPAVVMEPLTEHMFESKLYYYSESFDDQVRTFCVCPYGEVVVENNGGLLTVNGHSYEETRTENTNFALLVSKTFTEPFKDPIAYGKYIASLANLLAGGVLVQRLGDLLAGRRSTARRLARGMVRPTLKEAVPGDLSLVLPYRHLIDILETLRALDRLAPGVYSRHTLLYGVEVKFYSSRLELDNSLETRVRNLFAAGDGAGVTRGLAQASASGVHVARAILSRLGEGG